MTDKMMRRNIRIKAELEQRIVKGYRLKEALWAVHDLEWCYLSYKQLERIYYETRLPAETG